ncbi:MAG TPA: phytanoyl-CoA dioxygenase family protein [Planctomycetota bacterium]|nr:phytanoyl-CoA dioxygenase family protein [Planctomycetota bacterium]
MKTKTDSSLSTAVATLEAPENAGTRFTPEEIAHYNTEGYVVVPRLFSASEVQSAHDAIHELTRKAAAGDGSKVLELEPEAVNGQRVARRIYNPFLAHETFHKLGTDPRVLDRIEDLIGRNICCNLSKLNMKPAKVGSIVDWHQDLSYYPHTNADLVTVLVYLDDATTENGCLQVIPRHQHHYFSHSRPDGTFAGLISEDLDSGKYGKPVPLAAPAGSVIFMHCVLPHSSLPNRSEKSRRTLIYSYRAADAFPIFYSPSVVEFESKVRLVRGSIPDRARFGGPPPIIPRVGTEMKSLYQMQLEAKSFLPTANTKTRSH